MNQLIGLLWLILMLWAVFLGNCAVSLSDDTFNLSQFHLHTLSEHTVDGKNMDGEIHFVHASGDGKSLLVVGVFIQIGPKSDSWLGPVLDALEMVNSTTRSDAIVVNLYVSMMSA